MPVFRILLIIFLLVPLLEIYLLIKVGEVVGAWPTVLLVVGTAVLGAWLLRLQGLATLAQVQTRLTQGELPAIPLLEGMLLLICGALLLTPGFFTDGVGFALLVPPLRRVCATWLLQHGMFMAGPVSPPADATTDRRETYTIEGEFRHKDED